MNKHIFSCLLLFVLLTGLTSAYSQTTYVWTGTVNNVWANAGNWSVSSGPGTTWPGNGTTTDIAQFQTVAGGNSGSPVTITAATTIAELDVYGTPASPGVPFTGTNTATYIAATAASPGLTLTNLLVTGTLTFQGASTVLIQNGGTANGATGGTGGLDIDGSTSAGTLNFTGSSEFLIASGGVVLNELQNNGGTMNFSSSSTFLVETGSNFENDGFFNFDASTLEVANGSGIANTGAITLTTNVTGSHFVMDASLVTAPGYFVNSGAFTQSGALTTWTVNDYDVFFIVAVGSLTSTNCVLTFQGANPQLCNAGYITDNGSTYNFTGSATANGSYANGYFYTSVSGLFGNPLPLKFGKFYSFFNCGGRQSGSLGGGVTTVGTQMNFSGTIGGTVAGFTPYSFVNGTSGTATAENGDFALGPNSIITLSGTNSTVLNQNANCTFLLQSDATGSAIIGQITGAAAATPFQGNYYVQRYISAFSNFGYRLLSAPVYSSSTTAVDLSYLRNVATLPVGSNNGAIFAGAATGGPGGTTNGFTLDDQTRGGQPTIYVYNEFLNPPPAYTGASQTFFNEKQVGLVQVTSGTEKYSNLNMSPTSASFSFLPGTGFTFYYIGSAAGAALPGAGVTGPATACTVTWGGRMNTGNISYVNWASTTGSAGTNYPATSGTQLTYTAAAPYAGFNLVGNPYPCTIDLNQVATDNPGINSFYELDVNQFFDAYIPPSNIGGLQYYSTTPTLTPNGSGSAATQYVSSGMGFYAAVSAPQALVFKEDQKASLGNQYNPSSGPTFLALRSGGSDRAVVSATGNSVGSIHLALQRDSLTAKSCGIYFNEASSDKYDRFDAKDFDGIAPSVYMSSYTSDGVRTSINGLGSYTKGKNVKLFVNAAVSGIYKLNLTDIANIDMSVFKVLLVDNYKKDTVDLASTKSYSFSIATADTNSFGANRFVLSIHMRPLPQYKLISFNGAKENSTVTLNWKAANEGDYTGFGIQKLDASSNQYSTVYNVQSNGAGNYSFVDKSPVAGVNTYRLLQNNVDSATSYSRSLSINFTSSDIGALSVYPNPAKDVLTVNFNNVTAITSDIYNVNIYNSMGVLIMQKSISANSLSQDVSALKPGAYIIEVKTNYGNSIGNAKFVKN